MTAFRMPAEWSSHDGCLMAWPTRTDLWGSVLDDVKEEYANVARAISEFEPVTMVAPPGFGDDARTVCGPDVTVIEMPLDDSWFRDSAPLFVLDGDGRRAGVDFRFNAWGGKHHPFDSDDRISGLLLEHLGVERIHSDMILEGGAITVDGEGTLITTEQCLLHPNRNPDMNRDEIEAELKSRLGVDKVIWLPYGGLLDEETNGHVDGVCA
ncbi:agmatine/peptidylarginine deiminase, partial [Streptomyces sp. NPDC059656]